MTTTTDIDSGPIGGLVIVVADREVELRSGAPALRLPIGPLMLVGGPLEHADPPSPAQLTNALGIVHDYLDDAVMAAPDIEAAPTVTVVGDHPLSFARVELGVDDVPHGYRLRRDDADEVFRTLVVEPSAQRRFNPGLDDAHVDTIIGTSCVILGVMRRFALREITIAPTAGAVG